MIVVHTRLPIKEEFQEEFLNHLQDKLLDKDLQNLEGFEGMGLLKPLSIPNMPKNLVFVVETRWRDLPSFLAYTRSEAFRKSHQNLPPKEWYAGQVGVEVFQKD